MKGCMLKMSGSTFNVQLNPCSEHKMANIYISNTETSLLLITGEDTELANGILLTWAR